MVLTMVDFYDTQDEASLHFKAMQSLVVETRHPLDEVKRVYEGEFDSLRMNARVKDYLVLLTSRKVRERLRTGG